MEHKMEHEIIENSSSDNGSNGAPLSRQMTVALTPEQYEKLFFQPSAPRGDLAKRLANPTLFGLLSFLIPYTSTIFCLSGLQNAVAPTSLIGLTADYYFLGAIGMNLAGVAEFVLGNTFPCSVFIIYGCHWGSLGYNQDPWHPSAAGFSTAVGGSTGAAYNASQGFHNVTMTLVSFVFLIASFRVNVPFVLTFIGLIGLFAFTAAADFAVPTATTAADVKHIDTMIKCAGGFGWLGLLMGWYLAIITSAATVNIPLPLPVFDLSGKIFPSQNKLHRDGSDKA